MSERERDGGRAGEGQSGGAAQKASDLMMRVSSETLSAGAKQLRDTVGDKAAILRNGVKANAAQLDAGARILREGPKSVITSGGDPTQLGVEHELPAWIDAARQEKETVLRLDVGILSGGSYLIDRTGKVEETRRYG